MDDSFWIDSKNIIFVKELCAPATESLFHFLHEDWSVMDVLKDAGYEVLVLSIIPITFVVPIPTIVPVLFVVPAPGIQSAD